MSMRNELSKSAGLLISVEAVRNVRAAVLLLASFVLAGLAFGLGGMLSFKVHALFGFIFGLVGLGVVFYGSNATGIMLMDQARGAPARPLLSAVFASLATGHRLLGVLLIAAIAYLVGLLAMAVALLICKVPGLGPFLFTFVFPICVVLAGVAIFAFYAVVLPLAAPAIWAGATTLQSVSRLSAIARARTIGVVLSMLVLMLIVSAVAGIVFGVMAIGTVFAGTLSAAIVGFGGLNPLSMVSGLGGLSEAGSYAGAGAIGGGVVWAVALTLPALVYVRGCCQVYLANVEEVDVGATEERIRASLDAAQRKADEIRSYGESLAHPPLAAAGVGSVSAGAPQPATAGAFACPACGAAASRDDLFCGSCGHRIAA